jgi:hypothetical protein
MNSLIVLGNLAAGFVGGAIAWFATNFGASQYLNFWTFGYKIAAQIGGITATSSPLILWVLRKRGYDLPVATQELIGLSNTLAEPFGANLSHRENAQRALLLPPCSRLSATG